MPEYSIRMTKSFQEIYPTAALGVLMLEDVSNPKTDAKLDQLKVELEQNLRNTYAEKAALRSHPASLCSLL